MMRRLSFVLLLAAAFPLHAQAPASVQAQAPVQARSPVQTPASPAATALLGPSMHVANVERSLAFYVKALGMRVNLQIGPANNRETMLGFGQDSSQAGIILLSDETGAKPRPIAHAHGFSRLVVRVTDIAGVVARLRAAGFTASDVRDVAQGYRMAMATDPDGYKLELVERPSSQEKAR